MQLQVLPHLIAAAGAGFDIEVRGQGSVKKLEVMSSLNVISVQCEGDKGAKIDDCLRDAAILSLTDRINVTFTHNDRKYEVRFNDLIGQFHEVLSTP